MEIRKIQTTDEFDKLTEWRTLQVYTFGPLMDLENSEDVNVLVAVVVRYVLWKDKDNDRKYKQ